MLNWRDGFYFKNHCYGNFYYIKKVSPYEYRTKRVDRHNVSLISTQELIDDFTKVNATYVLEQLATMQLIRGSRYGIKLYANFLKLGCTWFFYEDMYAFLKKAHRLSTHRYSSSKIYIMGGIHRDTYAERYVPIKISVRRYNDTKYKKEMSSFVIDDEYTDDYIDTVECKDINKFIRIFNTYYGTEVKTVKEYKGV